MYTKYNPVSLTLDTYDCKGWLVEEKPEDSMLKRDKKEELD